MLGPLLQNFICFQGYGLLFAKILWRHILPQPGAYHTCWITLSFPVKFPMKELKRDTPEILGATYLEQSSLQGPKTRAKNGRPDTTSLRILPVLRFARPCFSSPLKRTQRTGAKQGVDRQVTSSYAEGAPSYDSNQPTDNTSRKTKVFVLPFTFVLLFSRTSPKITEKRPSQTPSPFLLISKGWDVSSKTKTALACVYIICKKDLLVFLH